MGILGCQVIAVPGTKQIVIVLGKTTTFDYVIGGQNVSLLNVFVILGQTAVFGFQALSMLDNMF